MAAVGMTTAPSTVVPGCSVERIYLNPDMVEVSMLDGHVAATWACCVLRSPSPSPHARAGVEGLGAAPTSARHISTWLAPVRCKRPARSSGPMAGPSHLNRTTAVEALSGRHVVWQNCPK